MSELLDKITEKIFSKKGRSISAAMELHSAMGTVSILRSRRKKISRGSTFS